MHSGFVSGSSPSRTSCLTCMWVCGFSRLRVILCWLRSGSNLIRCHRNDARHASLLQSDRQASCGAAVLSLFDDVSREPAVIFSPGRDLNGPPLSPNLQFISGTLFWNARSTRARLMRGRVHANTERLWIERPPLKTELIPFEVRGKRGKHSISL